MVCVCTPDFSALRATFFFPSTLRGPVDFSHGFQRLIASAWRRLRSSLQLMASCSRFISPLRQ